MEKILLPPLLSEVKNGEIIWKKLNSINYDQIGYLLTCHLIIEHYLDQYIKIKSHKSLSWDQAKLTFNQKISLLSKQEFPSQYDFIPSIKHLNTLRNRLSHNIDTTLTIKDFLPIIELLKKTKPTQNFTDVSSILEGFTSFVCSWIASLLAFSAKPSSTEEESRQRFEDWIMNHSGVTSRDILKRHPSSPSE